MSTDEHEPEATVSVTDPPGESESDTQATDTPAEHKLELEVAITDAGPCKKHLKITIPRTEIERQYELSLEKLRQDAMVPGFRQGRAPRQLVVKRFRKQVADQVKSTLLMSSLEQIDKDKKLDPIVQPQLDVEAIELPETGPMSFEMDVEVRPQFDLPNYKGLKIKRPIFEVTESDVETQLSRHLESHGQIVPKFEGAAEIGDYITADILFLRPDGRPINEVKEVTFRLQTELRFQNGTFPDVASRLVGARPGDTREVEGRLGTAIEDPALRGATIGAQIRVNDLKRLRLPEFDQAFLNSIGFDSMTELRDEVREALKRRALVQQRQELRRQILDILLREAPFDLPRDLVLREEKSTINRLVAQMREEGMTEPQIRANEAAIRANAHESTLRSLKEFLLLLKIADAEGIKVGEEDVSLEIEAIAERTDESVRRIRARVEKEGGTDSLMTKILERRVIDRILEDVEVEDVVHKSEPQPEVETLDHTATAGPEKTPTGDPDPSHSTDGEHPQTDSSAEPVRVEPDRGE